MMKKQDRKRTPKTACRLFFMTLALATLAGCKSTEDSLGLNSERLDKTRAAIQTEIPDAERSKAMLAIANSFDAEAQEIIEDTKAVRLQIVEANRSYDTTREQLQQLYDELGAQIERLGNTTKEHSLKLRTLCSEAEWEEIFDHDDEVIEFKY
jgi:acetolactate synthase regulatory subunit